MLKNFVNMLAEAGLGIVGKTLFAAEMPAECDRGVLVRYPLDGVAIDPELPGYHRFDLEVIVRAKTVEDGDMLANQVMSVFHFDERKDVVDLGSGTVKFTINYMKPRTLPRIFPRMEGNGREWSFSVNTCTVKS
ncbi:MAG: hypothetical protein JJ979_03310 [Roseibium sp.]|nr:hypothetical protein [Roseibium sp.]